MKVAHVTLYPPKGEKHIGTSGVASYSKNLITNIPLKNQTVVCNKDDESEWYQEDAIEVRRAFSRGSKFALAVHKELKSVNADVIHIQQELALFGGITSAYILQWLVFFWRKKTVVTLHGVVDPKKIDKKFVLENNSSLPVPIVKLAFRIIYTPIMWWAKKIIVHEQYFKNIIVNSYHIPQEKVEVIPHGVEILSTINQREARQKLGLPVTADISLFMGYTTGYKGIDLLIKGFSEYAKRNPNAFLVIGAGKHPKLYDNAEYLKKYKKLQDMAKRLIPANQYTWIGFIDEVDIAAYYSASDVSLYPYTTALSSSGPMSFAIGYEKPFLVSMAFAEVFHSYPHLLFQHTAESLADKLDNFFHNREAYSQTSSDMKQHRNWGKVGMRTFAVYKELNGGEVA